MKKKKKIKKTGIRLLWKNFQEKQKLIHEIDFNRKKKETIKKRETIKKKETQRKRKLTQTHL